MKFEVQTTTNQYTQQSTSNHTLSREQLVILELGCTSEQVQSHPSNAAVRFDYKRLTAVTFHTWCSTGAVAPAACEVRRLLQNIDTVLHDAPEEGDFVGTDQKTDTYALFCLDCRETFAVSVVTLYL